jgi:LysM repeat protein
MTLWLSLSRAAPLLLWCAVLTGCGPAGQSPLEEVNEPHFLAGKSRINQMDYQGAMESFEKALEANPKSSAAHFELGCLFDQKDSDPAAAIYHYDRYLKLRPNADNAEIVKTRIVACKQELARSVSLEPVTQRLQGDLDRVNAQNKELRDELEKMRLAISRASAPASPSTATLAPAHAQLTPGAGQPSQTMAARANSAPGSPAASAVVRTHTIKAGETPTIIARKYGVKVDALMAANPRLDPRRLQVGQSLNIPSP